MRKLTSCSFLKTVYVIEWYFLGQFQVSASQTRCVIWCKIIICPIFHHLHNFQGTVPVPHLQFRILVNLGWRIFYIHGFNTWIKKHIQRGREVTLWFYSHLGQQTKHRKIFCVPRKICFEMSSLLINQ